MEFLDIFLEETDLINQSIEHRSYVGDNQKDETAEGALFEEYVLPSLQDTISNLLDDSNHDHNTSTVDHTSTPLSSVDVCPNNMAGHSAIDIALQQQNFESLSDLLGSYSEENSPTYYSDAETGIHPSFTNAAAFAFPQFAHRGVSVAPDPANGVNKDSAVTQHNHSATPIVADLAAPAPSAHCDDQWISNSFKYGNCETPSPYRHIGPDMAGPISTPHTIIDLEATPTTIPSGPALEAFPSTYGTKQGRAPIDPSIRADLGIELPTPSTSPPNPDSSGEGLEEQSSLIENPHKPPTPSVRFTYSQPSTLPLNQGNNYASKANLYVDQLDSCFDSLLSPAPAPGPGQGRSQDHNNNSDEFIPMENQTIQAGPTLPVSIRISPLENNDSELECLINLCDMTSADSDLEKMKKMDKTGFKTDLSNFYSNLALAVPPAVQSGQNIIPPMENSKRSMFFWNVNKFEEEGDEEILSRPDMKKVNYDPYDEDHSMSSPSFGRANVKEMDNELTRLTMKRGGADKNQVLQRPNNWKNWNVVHHQYEKLFKAKKRSRRYSVRKNSKRVKEVLPIEFMTAEKDPKVSGVVKNIRITSPIVPSCNQKSPLPDHSIQIYKRRQKSKRKSAKSTSSVLGTVCSDDLNEFNKGETTIVNHECEEALVNKYDDHDKAKAKCTSQGFSTSLDFDNSNESIVGEINVIVSGKVGNKMHDKEVGSRVHSSSLKTLVYQVCWRCKSSQSPDSWHAHKWQKDKFLCSTCFSFFKQKKTKRIPVTEGKKKSEISFSKGKHSCMHEKVVEVVAIPEVDVESNKVPCSQSGPVVDVSMGSISICLDD